jgi:hypothetical protein
MPCQYAVPAPRQIGFVPRILGDSLVSSHWRDHHDQAGGRTIPIRYRGKRLGDLPIEEAYIYPPKIGPMTRDEVRQTVMALLTRSGPAQPSTFTLADGSTRQAIPIGMHLNLAGPASGLQFELLDPATGQRQVVATDEVVNIQ